MKELIAEIQSKNIHIGVVDGELQVSFTSDHIDAALVEKIKENKQELISLLKKHAVEYSQNELKPVKKQRNYPLSFAQKHLWMTCQHDQNSTTHNMSISKPLRYVDVAKLRQAVADVIERHEILRTVFKEDENGEVKQWILTPEEVSFTLQFIDFKDKERPKDHVELHKKEHQYKSFDLEKESLMRVILYRITDNEYILYYNAHPMISDDVSLKNTIKEILAYYVGYMTDTPITLKPLQLQYKDYAVWQHNQKNYSEYKEHRSYWLDKFSGELPVLNLAPNNIRPKTLTNNGKQLHYFVKQHILTKVKKYAEANNGTLFMALLATWNVLLSTYASQDELIVGASLSDRDHPDLQDQIGRYIKTMPLRMKINMDGTFDEFFKKVKENTVSDFVHNQYPFDTLVEELDYNSDPSRNPLFDVMIMLHEADTHKLDLAEEDFEIHEQDFGPNLSKYDLHIELKEVFGGILHLNLIYNTDIYEEYFIRQLITHYNILLENLVSNPSQKMGTIAYLTAEENKKLADFNNEKIAFPEIELINSLFEKQARKNVDAIALEVSGETLTYRELDEKSNQFANYLISQGVSKGDYLPLYIERSLEMIVGILGIFKSGAVYIPLDVNLPKKQAQYIVNDVKARYFITKSSLLNTIELSAETQELHIDFDQLSLVSSGYPNKEISPNSEACIMYTSGTTGKPKGVVLKHQSLGAFLMNVEGQFKNISSQPVLASNGFDIFLFELFNPLLSGGKVILLKDEEVRNISYLLNIIENVAAFHAVPVLMAQIVKHIKDHGIQHKYTKVKELYIGGDEVPTPVLEDMYAVFPNATIHVFYGPTEGTVFITSKNYEPKETNFKGAVIGTPNISSQVYILDEYNKKVPFGVTGEICIGGAQVGKGYLHNEIVTTEKFIQNPFKANEKIYKTGDLAQWLPSNNITFIGRKDNQVKIRGHQIELEEIIKRLQSKAGVEKAIVVVKVKKEQKELVAYIVSNETQNMNELRNFLEETLPKYMIPSFFVNLDEIPQTANGKLDKDALPDLPDLGIQI